MMGILLDIVEIIYIYIYVCVCIYIYIYIYMSSIKCAVLFKSFMFLLE